MNHLYNRESVVLYEVAVGVNPFEKKPTESLGFYTTKDLAERVADLVRDTFSHNFASGIDIYLEKASSESTIRELNKRVETNRPTIFNQIDRKEVIRITDRISTLHEKAEKFSSPGFSGSCSLKEKNCYVLYENHERNTTPIGIYSSENVFHSVTNFLSMMQIPHHYEIEPARIVKFSSGAKAVLVQGKHQEQTEPPSLMRVPKEFDLLEAQRIIEKYRTE